MTQLKDPTADLAQHSISDMVIRVCKGFPLFVIADSSKLRDVFLWEVTPRTWCFPQVADGRQ
ncbi:hypothetical protein B0H10DRAFT_2049476 [Mycena sp. CBHHK59/15]|nr:hypothetical protein B0H10DRAFT_2049476 [Mycena sp. CBHHK59/15]